VLIKRTDSSGDWLTWDAARSPDNIVNKFLYPNLSNAEATSGADIDFVANGVKVRNAGGINTSGATYIFMAFAEAPFKYANAR
jgi:hypothetical protein